MVETGNEIDDVCSHELFAADLVGWLENALLKHSLLARAMSSSCPNRLCEYPTRVLYRLL